MKNLLVISVLAALTLSNVVLASDADLKIITIAGASSLTGYPALGFATLSQAYLMGYVNDASNAASASTSGKNQKKMELDYLIKSNIQEYNLSGELSPVLAEIVSATKDSNPELSTEDILTNLENNL